MSRLFYLLQDLPVSSLAEYQQKVKQMNLLVTPNDNDITTFRRIRKSIGILGISLPVVLILFSMIPVFKTSVQPSISHYYYTNLRELFTGVLCAVGLFLFNYKGHSNTNFLKNDSKLTNIAGSMAFGIALMPTNPEACTFKIYSLLPFCNVELGWLHYIFAGIFRESYGRPASRSIISARICSRAKT